MAKMTKQEKLILNKRSLILAYVWMGLSVLGALVLLVRQLLPATRTATAAFLGTFWIPVLSLCMAVCMMANKLLDRKILLDLVKLDGYNGAAQKKPEEAEAADGEEPAGGEQNADNE